MTDISDREESRKLQREILRAQGAMLFEIPERTKVSVRYRLDPIQHKPYGKEARRAMRRGGP